MRMITKRGIFLWILSALFVVGLVFMTVSLVNNGDEWVMKRFNRHMYSDGTLIGAGTIYDKNDNKVWSVFEDEKVLSDKTLNDISKNMKSIEKQWDNYFEKLKVDINDDEGNILVGYAYIGHYESTYYMENDDLINSINKLSNELNDQENLRKQLTGDIAHELRTPLTSIKGHLDAIIVGIWEPTNERLNSINEEVKRITNLVDELRKLAKFDSGKDNLNKEIVNQKVNTRIYLNVFID